MSHGELPQPAELLESAEAEAVSGLMQALAAPSRVRILARLHAGPCSVNELAAAVGMDASAVSHQLRVLRLTGLVVGKRIGRQVVYGLHDEHVGHLLTESMSHVEHRQRGLSETPRRRRAAA